MIRHNSTKSYRGCQFIENDKPLTALIKFSDGLDVSRRKLSWFPQSLDLTQRKKYVKLISQQHSWQMNSGNIFGGFAQRQLRLTVNQLLRVREFESHTRHKVSWMKNQHRQNPTYSLSKHWKPWQLCASYKDQVQNLTRELGQVIW